MGLLWGMVPDQDERLLSTNSFGGATKWHRYSAQQLYKDNNDFMSDDRFTKLEEVQLQQWNSMQQPTWCIQLFKWTL